MRHEWVTGAAAAALDANNRFVLPRAAAPGEISEQQAAALSQAWLKRFGPITRAALEQDRGGPIDVPSLTLCDRPYYAATSYGTIDGDVPDAVRQVHGSWWLTTYCNPGGEAQVSISVSALATNVTITNGEVQYPVSHGMEFVWYGIPQSFDRMPVSAEQAVEAAFSTTGVQVTQVPELVAVPRPKAPYLAQWRLTLARPVALRSASGTTRSSSELYVRYTGGSDRPVMFIPSVNQPADAEVPLGATVALRRDDSGKLSPVGPMPRMTSTRVTRAPGRALTFEQVTAAGGEVRP